MPVCLHCSRTFLSKEALHQHIRSSSIEHPFCATCDRRFISQAACDSHMAAKHPPTFDCVLCNRSFPAMFALEDHYRGSASHPNCAKCGRGFKDQVERDEHQTTAHPKVVCLHCGALMYEDSLEDHYLQSSDHPSCKQCNRGFKDDRTWEEHMAIGHPDLRCEKCERQFETAEAVRNHYFASPVHPECTSCNRGFKDDVQYNAHMQLHQSHTTVELDSIHGLSPLSPRSFKDLIRGDIRSDVVASPVLSLQMEYASPIKDVPTPFSSPTTLPRPGRIVEEVWNARDNVQAPFSRVAERALDYTNVAKISPSPLTQVSSSKDNMYKQLGFYSSPPPAIVNSEQVQSPNIHNTLYAEPPSLRNMAPLDVTVSRFSSTSGWRPRRSHLPILGGSSEISDRRADGQHSTSAKYGLYAGSALSRFRSNSLLSPSTFEGKAPLDPSIIHPFSQSIVNWREVMGDKDPLITANGKSASLSDISTQAADTPVHKFAPLDPATSPLGNSLSPNSASFPESSFSPWTTPPPNVGPSVLSSSQNPSLYITSPTAPSHSPTSNYSQSPEVSSPIGLAALPAVIPLASPVDFCADQQSADILGAQELTSESMQSQMQIFADTKLPESPSIESLTSSQHSFTTITSPQDSNADQPFQGDILAVKLPDSPNSEHLLSPAYDKSSSASSSHFRHDARVDRSTSPTAFELPEDDTSSAISGTPLSAMPYPRLYCRLCQSDPCVDMTATMCGHIFCYKCITDEIMKTSRCPMCTTPTLLYCLFRLDLSQ